VHFVFEEKGDAPMQWSFHISGTRVSFLLNMHKKDCQQNIFHAMLLAPARYGAHPAGPTQQAPRGAQAV
jgi:hypothetical protein